MGKETTPPRRAARSTRGKPAPRLADESEKENETPGAPKQRKSRATKPVGERRKSRTVKLKMPLFYTDFFDGTTDEDWDAMAAADQLVAKQQIDTFLSDKSKQGLPKRWLNGQLEGRNLFSWRAKTDEEQTAAILELGGAAKARHKQSKSKHGVERTKNIAAGKAAALAAAAALLEDGGGGGGEEGGGAAGAAGGGAPAAEVAQRPNKQDRHTRNVRDKILRLHRMAAEINTDLAKLEVPGGPVHQVMVVECDDQTPANTGGGSTSKANLVRDKRFFRVTAADTAIPKYLAEVMINAFSLQPAKIAAANSVTECLCSVAAVNTMIKTEKELRSRAPTVNHQQLLSTTVVAEGLPMPGQPYVPVLAPAHT
jgi:hypothetical protein